MRFSLLCQEPLCVPDPPSFVHRQKFDGASGCLRGLDTQHSRMLIDIVFLETADSTNLRVMCLSHNHGAQKVEISALSGLEARILDLTLKNGPFSDGDENIII